jgi:YHS domain-containing protein
MAHPTNLNEQAIALQGYDPVSYFEDHPVVGNSQITSTYEGATYHFATVEHKSLFDADPENYIPQYGGFCAVAVSEGKLVPVDPETYTVDAGKLYLFYNGEFGNTKPQWEADTENLRRQADANWSSGNLAPL